MLKSASSQALPPLEDSLSASQLAWLRRQRNDYVDHYLLQYTTSCKLDKDQIKALSKLHPEWYKTPRERQWDLQFRALEDFHEENGRLARNCTFPRISISEVVFDLIFLLFS